MKYKLLVQFSTRVNSSKRPTALPLCDKDAHDKSVDFLHILVASVKLATKRVRTAEQWPHLGSMDHAEAYRLMIKLLALVKDIAGPSRSTIFFLPQGPKGESTSHREMLGLDSPVTQRNGEALTTAPPSVTLASRPFYSATVESGD
jgi:hypothetical protein